jgi:hypothetical protein
MSYKLKLLLFYNYIKIGNYFSGNSCVRISSGEGNKLLIAGYDVHDVPNSFQNLVLESQKKVEPDQTPVKYSASSYRRIEKKTKEATSTTSDKSGQNKRRYQAKSDVYNAFCRAIMWSVLERSLGHPIDDRIHFSTDKSSHFLNAPTKQVLLSAIGVKQELKASHRDVKTTKTGLEEKNRGFSYTPITNAAGETNAWTTHITDHTFNKDGRVKTYKICEEPRRYLQTIPTGPPPTEPVISTAESTIIGTDTELEDVIAGLLELQEIQTEVFGDGIQLPPIIHVNLTSNTDTSIPCEGLKTAEDIAADLDYERILEELKNKFGAQEAEQYINLIYIPVMKERRVKAILEDYYNVDGICGT